MIDSRRVILCACLLLLTACNNDQKAKDSQLALMKTTDPAPLMTDTNKSGDKVEDIKKDVSSYPDVYDVAVVKGKKDTLVVYKVKHMQRFQMKRIEKDINKMLEKKYPKENFTVSSDYKIFLEAVRLNEKMKADKHYPQQKAEKRLKQIVTMTKEMT
jgi:hypothetical protein